MPGIPPYRIGAPGLVNWQIAIPAIRDAGFLQDSQRRLVNGFDICR